MKLRTFGVILFLSTVASLTFYSCAHEPYVAPLSARTGDSGICFERDVLPVFGTSCAKSGCHDGTMQGEGSEWVFKTYEDIVSKGIVPGNPAASRLYQVMAGTAGKHTADATVSPEHVDRIGRWIASGALNGTNCPVLCDTTVYTYSGAVEPTLRNYCVNCHYNGAQDVGGIRLDNYSRVKLAVADSTKFLAVLRHTPGYPAMPRDGIQLSPCQVKQIEKWIKNGMQND